MFSAWINLSVACFHYTNHQHSNLHSLCKAIKQCFVKISYSHDANQSQSTPISSRNNNKTATHLSLSHCQFVFNFFLCVSSQNQINWIFDNAESSDNIDTTSDINDGHGRDMCYATLLFEWPLKAFVQCHQNRYMFRSAFIIIYAYHTNTLRSMWFVIK